MRTSTAPALRLPPSRAAAARRSAGSSPARHQQRAQKEQLKEQAKDWSLGPLFLIVPFGFVLATMQFQEMLQRIMFKFKG